MAGRQARGIHGVICAAGRLSIRVGDYTCSHPAQLDEYRKAGVVIPPDPLRTADVKAMHVKMEAFLPANPKLSPDYIPDLIAFDRSWPE